MDQLQQTNNSFSKQQAPEQEKKIPPFDPFIDEEAESKSQFYGNDEPEEEEKEEETELSLISPLDLQRSIEQDRQWKVSPCKAEQVQNTDRIEKAMSELLEKSIEKITWLKNEEKTELTFFYQSRIFDELEISIDHYQTDPASFYITFKGNEALQKAILQNQNDLQTKLKERLPSFQCHIASPIFKTFESKRSRLSKKAIEKTEEFSYSADRNEDKSHA